MLLEARTPEAAHPTSFVIHSTVTAVGLLVPQAALVVPWLCSEAGAVSLVVCPPGTGTGGMTRG